MQIIWVTNVYWCSDRFKMKYVSIPFLNWNFFLSFSGHESSVSYAIPSSNATSFECSCEKNSQSSFPNFVLKNLQWDCWKFNCQYIWPLKPNVKFVLSLFDVKKVPHVIKRSGLWLSRAKSKSKITNLSETSLSISIIEN